MRTKLILLSFLIFIFFTGCGKKSQEEYNPPRDNNGTLPQDTVRNFIQLVIKKDFDNARKLWYGESSRISKLSDGSVHDATIPFEEFCSYYKNITNISKLKISEPYEGKSGFSMVYIEWLENEQRKAHTFGLKIINGEWKMERGSYW